MTRSLFIILSILCFSCGSEEPRGTEEANSVDESAANEAEGNEAEANAGRSTIERLRAEAEAERRRGTEGTMTFKVNGEPREMSFFSVANNQVSSTSTTIGGHTSADREDGLEIVMSFVDARNLELPADVVSAPPPRNLQEATNVTSRPNVVFTYRAAGDSTRAPGRDVAVHIESLADGFLSGSVDEIEFGRGENRVVVSDVSFRVQVGQSAGADAAGSALVGATERATRAATMQ